VTTITTLQSTLSPQHQHDAAAAHVTDARMQCRRKSGRRRYIPSSGKLFGICKRKRKTTRERQWNADRLQRECQGSGNEDVDGNQRNPEEVRVPPGQKL
jgi:hypothetical protein